jgi:hypothetical protein
VRQLHDGGAVGRFCGNELFVVGCDLQGHGGGKQARHDLHGVGRAARHERLAFAVEDLPAGRRDRQVADPVGVGLLHVLFA